MKQRWHTALPNAGPARDVVEGENMKSRSFRRAFASERARLAKAKVAFVEVPGPLELYLLEVYAAMKLGTGRWNSFDTH